MSSPPPYGSDLHDARLFLYDIDLNSGQAGFVRTDRAALSSAPFLDHRWRTPGHVDVKRPLSELQAIGAEPPPEISFIWHTSFCASTLLAACFDTPGQCLALKEPASLMMLADLKRAARLGGLAKPVFNLLGRRFDPDEQILIKPSNGANGLIGEAAAFTRGRMLLLYSDCESFILSMAKQGANGFSYVRSLFSGLIADGHPVARTPAAEMLRLNDLQLTALVWRMQMDVLEAASARLGDRARSLDCRVLMDDPGLVLSRADDFLGLGLGPARLEEVAEGPLFRRNAKAPGQTFDARAREDERAQLRAHLGSDLTNILKWMETASPRPPQLAPPLMSSNPSRSYAAQVGLAAAGV